MNYETIMIGFMVAIAVAWVLFILYEVGVCAAGFVFDDVSGSIEKHSFMCKLSDGDPSLGWMLSTFIAPTSVVMFGGLWPLTILIAVIGGILLLLRKIVRTSKKALQQHVTDLHKEVK